MAGIRTQVVGLGSQYANHCTTIALVFIDLQINILGELKSFLGNAFKEILRFSYYFTLSQSGCGQ
jgi:hypothetical protein